MTPAACPPYPASLTPEERRAVMLTAARDATAAVIKEGGHVDRSILEAEAVAQVLAAWTAERVAALEARVAALEARGEA